MSSNHPPDIYLERNSTRIVTPLHVVEGQGQFPPRIRADPATETLALERPSSPGAYLTVDDGSTRGLSRLEAASGRGECFLHDPDAGTNGTIRVVLTADRPTRPVSIQADDETTEVRVTTTSDTAGIDVNDTDGDRRVRVESEAIPEREVGYGRIVVYDDETTPTARFEGNDGALLVDRNGNGGEFLLKTLPTGDPSDRDISIHATAAPNSQYGLSQGIRPLIHLNGPAGRVELGRNERNRQDGETYNVRGEGAAGRVFLNYYDTSAPTLNPGATRLLEAGIGWPQGQRMENTTIRCGEFFFRRARRGTWESGRLTTCGPAGVTFRSGDGSPMLRVEADQTVKTSQQIDEGGLPLSDIDIVPSVVDVYQGQTVDVEIDVGNLTMVSVRFGDEETDGYELQADVTGIDDSSFTLEFDADAAGDPNAQTITVVQGNATVDRGTVEETDLTNPIDVGTYDVVADFMHKGDVAAMEVTEVAPPTIDPDPVVVEEGDLAQFLVYVDVADELDLLIEDPDGLYELEATVTNIGENPVELVFDHSASGDPSQDTLILTSNGDLTIVDEDSGGRIAPGDYDLLAVTDGGGVAATLTVEGSFT